MLRDRVSRVSVRRNLGHFALGKVLSSVIGVALLLLLVRALPRDEYGAYVAFWAIFEMGQLGTNLGAFAGVFRYVPELRARGDARQLGRVLHHLVLYRAATLLLAAGVLALFGGQLAGYIGLGRYADLFPIFSVFLFFEGVARFLDIVFESLLMQGVAQATFLVRNLARIGALLVAANSSYGFSLSTWIAIESACSALGCVLGTALLRRVGRADGVPHAGTDSEPFPWRRILKFAGPTYVAQMLGLCSGPDAGKLIVGRISGMAEAAAFGFAAALVATIQRYMPAFLLIGMVRPLFVVAKEQGRSPRELVEMSGTVLKLNMLALGPVIVAIIVAGPVVVAVLSGGRLPESLPYLVFLMALLLLQVLHAIIGLLANVYEEAMGSVVGTALGLGALLAALGLGRQMGVAALCAGLALSEAVWCGSMVLALRRHGVGFRLPLGALGKLSACVGLCCVPARFMLEQLGASNEKTTALAFACAAALLFLVLAAVMKPFSAEERERINGLLPAPLFIW